MGEPIFVLDLNGFRLDAIDVAKFIIDLSAWGYHGITMRWVPDEGYPFIEFYEDDNPKVTIGLVKNFAL